MLWSRPNITRSRSASEKLLIFTHLLTGNEERWWEDELDADERPN
jgi:hypothetical protein